VKRKQNKYQLTDHQDQHPIETKMKFPVSSLSFVFTASVAASSVLFLDVDGKERGATNFDSRVKRRATVQQDNNSNDLFHSSTVETTVVDRTFDQDAASITRRHGEYFFGALSTKKSSSSLRDAHRPRRLQVKFDKDDELPSNGVASSVQTRDDPSDKSGKGGSDKSKKGACIVDVSFNASLTSCCVRIGKVVTVPQPLSSSFSLSICLSVNYLQSLSLCLLFLSVDCCYRSRSSRASMQILAHRVKKSTTGHANGPSSCSMKSRTVRRKVRKEERVTRKDLW
jgi:hypothetical protein